MKSKMIFLLLVILMLTCASSAPVHHRRGHQDLDFEISKTINCGQLDNEINLMKSIQTLSEYYPVWIDRNSLARLKYIFALRCAWV